MVEDHGKLSLQDCRNRVPIDEAIVTYVIVSEALLLGLCSMNFLNFIFIRMTKSNAQKQREYRERKKLNDEKYLEK